MNYSSSLRLTLPEIIPVEVFRAYDIRGPVGEEGLTPSLAYAIGLAIGTEASLLNQKSVIVGRDGRLSGPVLTDSLCQGLQEAGCHVIDIGMVPSPVLYFATHHLETQTGVMVTASHNPGHHNGFKIVLNGKTLTSEGITGLQNRINSRAFSSGEGVRKTFNILPDYIKTIVQQIKLARPLKVVIDCGNGVGSVVAPLLYRQLGCEVIELFCEVDGHFPNHHPDPTVPQNLQTLIQEVKKQKADIGIAFDGDADRIGVVTEQGEIIWPDRQMMLFSIDILSRLPGSEIIFDVKCTRQLAQVIREHGGKPVMWKTGHSILKAKLFETKAPLAGEMSGHIFFNEDWFGFDDGIYVGARLLRILSQDQRLVSEIFAALPNNISTHELKLPMPENLKAEFMQRLAMEGNFGSAEVITIDGLRVEYPEAWGLIRPSNTSPYLILRFEGENAESLQKVQEVFRRELLKINASLELPF